MFDNARLYNPPDSWVYKDAEHLQSVFEMALKNSHWAISTQKKLGKQPEGGQKFAPNSETSSFRKPNSKRKKLVLKR